jgi:hypothetical protein
METSKINFIVKSTSRCLKQEPPLISWYLLTKALSLTFTAIYVSLSKQVDNLYVAVKIITSFQWQT